MKDPNCIFCKIVNGEIPSTKVFETEEFLAFRDINPVAPTHVLIIPKEHYANTNETPTDARIFDKMHSIAKQVASQEGISESGYRTIINCGTEAGQEVFHIHLHVIGGKKLGTFW